ncbi:MAG: hypothetical protein ACOYD0_10200 [Candidatus Nanopelagicales bacterium]
MEPHAKARRQRRNKVIASASAVAVVASLGVVAASAPAHAVEGPIAYTFSGGNLAAGGTPKGTFSGHFVFNASKCPGGACPGAYSSISITTTASGSFTAKTYTNSDVYPLSTQDGFQVEIGTGPADLIYFPFGPGVLGVVGTHNVPTGGDPAREYQNGAGIRAATAGKIVGSHPELRVSTTGKRKLPRRGKLTVVRSAAVDPNWTGSLRSVAVKCTMKRSSAKSSKLCKVSTNSSTGKVRITTKGYRGVKAQVTIKTKALVPSVYSAETWQKTWKVK